MEKETTKGKKKSPAPNYPDRFFVHILHDDNTYSTNVYTWSQILSGCPSVTDSDVARIEKLSVPDMEQTIKTILQLENAC